MAKVIHKFKLDVCDEQIVNIPGLIRFLSVQIQGAEPCLWALIDKDSTLDKIHFDFKIRFIGTGQELPQAEHETALQYIDTIQLSGYVWHVFNDNSRE